MLLIPLLSTSVLVLLLVLVRVLFSFEGIPQFQGIKVILPSCYRQRIHCNNTERGAEEGPIQRGQLLGEAALEDNAEFGVLVDEIFYRVEQQARMQLC